MDYANLISRVKYKPGWEFKLLTDEWGHTLQIQATVPHSRTLEPTTFHFLRIIPTLPDEKIFLSWFKAVLKEAEMHELREFFRFDGELVDDPHAPVAVA
jgi:hypothetical protein